MSGSLSWKRLCIAVSIVVAAGGISAQDTETAIKAKDETAAPSVDLEKAKTDRKLEQEDTTNQTKSRTNLRMIGLAAHTYFDARKRMPGDLTDKDGKALLSWRVAILPYLDQRALFKEFNLDEPWDSKHNIKLLAKMPVEYSSARIRLKSSGNTVYQVFKGPEALFGRATPLSLASIPDGRPNTIMAVEATRAVPWTKPADMPFDRNKDVPDFGKAYGKRPLALMCDGNVRVLDLAKIKAETLKNAIDPTDGKTLGKDWEKGAED